MIHDREQLLLEAERFAEDLCPSAEVDSTLRHQLELLRPDPGDAGEMPPQLVVENIHGDGRQIVVVPVLLQELWNTYDARRKFIRGLGGYFAEQKHQPVVIYLFTEAWCKPWAEGEPRPVNLHLEEVKQEIIVASAMTIDGRVGLILSEIERDAEARISRYRDMHSIPCGSKQDNGEAHAEAAILKPFFYGYLHARFGPRDA